MFVTSSVRLEVITEMRDETTIPSYGSVDVANDFIMGESSIGAKFFAGFIHRNLCDPKMY